MEKYITRLETFEKLIYEQKLANFGGVKLLILTTSNVKKIIINKKFFALKITILENALVPDSFQP